MGRSKKMQDLDPEKLILHGDEPAGGGNGHDAAAEEPFLLFGSQIRDPNFKHPPLNPRLEATAADRHIDSFVIERASDVLTLDVRWLWPGRIPAGRVTLLAGDPGIAKSMLAVDLAARVSRGAPWPDAPDKKQEPANVLFFSMEDDMRETIVPRLKQAGADLSRVMIIEGVYNVPPFRNQQYRRRFSMPQDLRSLGLALHKLHPVGLVVFDPITAHCGKGEASGPQVHAMMWPLADLVARYGAACLCTTHLRKGASAKSVHRMAGSLSFTTAARAVWAVVRDPDDEARRILSPVKLNLAPVTDGLGFRLVDGRVKWDTQPVEVTADGALDAEHWGPKVREAAEWLLEVLTEGEQPVRALFRQAHECGIKEPALHRARKRMNLRKRKEGFGAAGCWHWSLPANHGAGFQPAACGAAEEPGSLETCPNGKSEEN